MADAAKGSISSSQQDDKYRQKIDELAKKIEKIREEKMQCSPVANIKRSIASSKVDHSKKLKKGLHHPHLELIMYELAHSPFLTPPVQTYSDSTLHLNEDVKKIRQKMDAPPPVVDYADKYLKKNKKRNNSVDTQDKDGDNFSDLPKTLEEAKKIFIKEVLNFRTVYKVLIEMYLHTYIYSTIKYMS